MSWVYLILRFLFAASLRGEYEVVDTFIGVADVL